MRFRSLLPRAALASLIGLLATAAWADLNFPHPLTNAPGAGIGGNEPTIDSEIRENAEAVFGFELSASQLEKTQHWKTSDFQWWTDTTRESQAQSTVAEIYRVTGLYDNDTDLRVSLEDSIDLFGVEVLRHSIGGSGSSNDQMTVIIDPRKRPDLVSYREILLKVLDHFEATSKTGEPNREIFYQLFPELEGASFGRTNPLTIDTFLTDVRNLIEQYEAQLDAEREEHLMPLLRNHALNRGASLTLAAFETMEITAENADKEALNIALEDFLALQDSRTFPGELLPSEALARSIIEGFMPQATRTLYLPTRSKRQEIATELRQAFEDSDPTGGVR